MLKIHQSKNCDNTYYIYQKPKSLVVWVGETCLVTWEIRRVYELTVRPVENSTTLIWYLENLFDVHINKFTIFLKVRKTNAKA